MLAEIILIEVIAESFWRLWVDYYTNDYLIKYYSTVEYYNMKNIGLSKSSKFKLSSIALVIASLGISLAACNGGGSGGSSNSNGGGTPHNIIESSIPLKGMASVAYVPYSNSDNIGTLAIDATNGNLSDLGSKYNVTTAKRPLQVVVDHQAKNAYVVNHDGLSISQYKIDPFSGKLKYAYKIPVNAKGTPQAMTIAPDDSYVYVVNYSDDDKKGKGTGEVVVFKQVESGGLTQVSKVGDQNGPMAVVVNPQGNYVYVANSTNNSITEFKVESGNLTSIGSGSVDSHASSPFAMAMDKDGKFLFVVNYDGHSVSSFKVDQKTGELTYIDKAETEEKPHSIAITPDGKYVYVANSDSGTVSEYAVAEDGKLNPLALPSVPAGNSGKKTWSVKCDPTGKYLYALNTDDKMIHAFSIGQDGTLKALSDLSIAGDGNGAYDITPVSLRH